MKKIKDQQVTNAYGYDPVIYALDDDKQRFYLDDVDEEAINEHINMIKEDETLTTSQDSSMEAIQNLNAKIDKMKSRVEGLQQENQALKEQKGTSSNDNQNENLRILMKIQEDKENCLIWDR